MRHIILSLILMSACSDKPATPVGKLVPLQKQDGNVLIAMSNIDSGDLFVGGKIAISGSQLKIAKIDDDNWRMPSTVHVDAHSAFMQAAKELQCGQNNCVMVIAPRSANHSLYVVMSVHGGTSCISWDISENDYIVRRLSCN